MPQNDDPENGDQTFETRQNTAGFAQRPAPQNGFGFAADGPELPEELTPDELDARQAEISTQRRKAPLPEGDEVESPGLGLAVGEDEERRAGPTEVKEP